MSRSTTLGRAWRLAGLSAGVTGSYLGYMMQRQFLSEDAREHKRRSVHTKAGRQIREELQLLRGPVMKLGQALSMHGEIVPEEMLAELTKLQMEAPGMHPSLVDAQFMASLRRPPDELFKSFEPEPFAAASLGQVHRAVTRDGTAVAVKVQYPNIKTSIENDFRLLRNFALPARASGHIPKASIDELETQILAETDYTREARYLEFFRSGLKPLGYVDVPAVFPKLSTDRILTMSVVPGKHLDAFLATRPSQKIRDLVGARLFELFYYQILKLEALHADPHAGNYLFTEDGRVGMVDFGCVKELGPEVVRQQRRSFLYLGPYDSPEFREMVEEQFGTPGRKFAPATWRAISNFTKNFYAKVYPPNPKDDGGAFDFSDSAFLRDYVDAATKLFRAKGTAPRFIFLARAEIGLYTTLHRLKSRVHTSAIVRRLL